MPTTEMVETKIGLVCVAALGMAACANDATTGSSSRQRVIIEGRSVYVVKVATEQEGRASVSICPRPGRRWRFSEIVNYLYRRTYTTAARFECTN